MFEKIKGTIQQAGESLKGQAHAIGDAAIEKANAIGDAAKEKGFQIIDQWISILPKLESYGLTIAYFTVGVSINPHFEVELRGKTKDFDLETIQKILDENKGSTPLTLVFTTMRTTLQLYQKAKAEKLEPLNVNIKVRLSPEIRVGFGKLLSA